jgi:hypothetical protein
MTTIKHAKATTHFEQLPVATVKHLRHELALKNTKRRRSVSTLTLVSKPTRDSRGVATR